MIWIEESFFELEKVKKRKQDWFDPVTWITTKNVILNILTQVNNNLCKYLHGLHLTEIPVGKSGVPGLLG